MLMVVYFIVVIDIIVVNAIIIIIIIVIVVNDSSVASLDARGWTVKERVLLTVFSKFVRVKRQQQ